MPANPKNAIDTNDAAISVTGSPLSDSGMFFSLITERTPEKSTIARRKPKPQPSELTIDSTKL